MDDFDSGILSQAKNEYAARLVTILSPLILEGIKSIYSEAVVLCKDNDEEEKYLMTFQNFLSRVPKWNDTIVEEETKRIVTNSRCSYLEDLLVDENDYNFLSGLGMGINIKLKEIALDIGFMNLGIAGAAYGMSFSFLRK